MVEESIFNFSSVKLSTYFTINITKFFIIFSRLSRLALALLCVPASSAASERVFSETGRILEARRQQLSRDSVDALVFLRNWFE